MGLPVLGHIFWERMTLTVGLSQGQEFQGPPVPPWPSKQQRSQTTQACWEVSSGQDPNFAKCNHVRGVWGGSEVRTVPGR